MSFSFLAGQCTMALLLRLPIEGRGALLLIPAVLFVRHWHRLAFAGGGFWQHLWDRGDSSLCHPFFWFLCSAESSMDPLPIFLQQGILDHLAGTLAHHAQNFFIDWDPIWGPWFLRFGFGMNTAHGDDWRRVYEELGLLHVLVVSGAHFSFLGWFCQIILEGPGRIGYALRIISFPVWQGWVTVARIVLTGFITVFALVVGFNPPCQRAWLGLLLNLWLPLIAAPMDETQKDRWVFTMQAVCFPCSFLSLSSALSWSAYTMVRYLKTWPRAWQRRLLPSVEGPLLTVNVSYFGFFSPSGLLLNNVLQPVWHIILGWGLVYWVWPEPLIGQGLQKILQLLHEIILRVHDFDQQGAAVPWEGQGRWGAFGRSLLWFAASWTFFSLWRRREDAC